MDVGDVSGKVLGVDNSAAVVTAFPNVEFAFQAKGKPAFDVLHCFFERDVWGGC